jgi:glycosyltransferase involved in cell wall biosynthesis
MDVANLGLADYLGRSGVEVHLVTHRAEASVTSLPSVVTHLVKRPMSSNLLGETLLELYARAVHQRLEGRRPIIVVNGGNARIPSTLNWVHFVHEASEPGSRWYSRVNRFRNVRREREAFGKARIIVADSLRTAADLRLRVGIESTQIHTVYYGVDRGRFSRATSEQKASLVDDLRLSARSYHAVFVGALGDCRKGFDTLFGAWQTLERGGDWDVDLLVVGVGREREKWLHLAQRCHLRSIQFLGFRNDVAAILRAVDLLIAPSRYEPYGLAVHEALCCGTPAIVSRSAGVAEQYPPELAELLLDDANSVSELATKLRQWRGSIEAYKRATLPVSIRLQTRSWDDMAKDIVGLVNGP